MLAPNAKRISPSVTGITAHAAISEPLRKHLCRVDQPNTNPAISADTISMISAVHSEPLYQLKFASMKPGRFECVLTSSAAYIIRNALMRFNPKSRRCLTASYSPRFRLMYIVYISRQTMKINPILPIRPSMGIPSRHASSLRHSSFTAPVTSLPCVSTSCHTSS